MSSASQSASPNNTSPFLQWPTASNNWTTSHSRPQLRTTLLNVTYKVNKPRSKCSTAQQLNSSTAVEIPPAQADKTECQHGCAQHHQHAQASPIPGEQAPAHAIQFTHILVNRNQQAVPTGSRAVGCCGVGNEGVQCSKDLSAAADEGVKGGVEEKGRPPSLGSVGKGFW